MFQCAKATQDLQNALWGYISLSFSLYGAVGP